MAGIALGLWLAVSQIQTTINITSKPELRITGASTDDDGVVAAPLLDGTDGPTAGDPSGPGPNSTRYANNIATCVATKHSPTDNTGTLAINVGYGGLYCTSAFGLQNGEVVFTLNGVKWENTALTECPAMTEVDTDTNGQPDLALCVSRFNDVGGGGGELPLIGMQFAPTTGATGLVKSRVLDTATPGQNISKTISFEGSFQH